MFLLLNPDLGYRIMVCVIATGPSSDDESILHHEDCQKVQLILKRWEIWGSFHSYDLWPLLPWLQVMNRHALAYTEEDVDQYVVMNPGLYHWRDGGEQHMNDPLSVANLQVQLLGFPKVINPALIKTGEKQNVLHFLWIKFHVCTEILYTIEKWY